MKIIFIKLCQNYELEKISFKAVFDFIFQKSENFFHFVIGENRGVFNKKVRINIGF